ncbi:hypothetical protein GQ600_8525 [Phytophthora cactorum]|nr:hypothetical protein GQ600_8525 [Phytophthora cactorum]
MSSERFPLLQQSSSLCRRHQDFWNIYKTKSTGARLSFP